MLIDLCFVVINKHMMVSSLMLILKTVFILWFKFRNTAEFGENTGFFAVLTPISGIVKSYDP